MKNFAKGVLIGTFGTLAAIASGVFTFHKTVVKPIEDQEESCHSKESFSSPSLINSIIKKRPEKTKRFFRPLSVTNSFRN